MCRITKYSSYHSLFSFSKKFLNRHQIECVLAFIMHLALSTMHMILLSAKESALFDTISMISLSSILATVLGSNPAKTSLCQTQLM